MLAANPFIGAYVQSDLFGKLIFLSLFALSALSWTLLVYKSWTLVQVRRLSLQFLSQFSEKEPLSLQFSRPMISGVPHILFEVYKSFKIRALAIIQRNHSSLYGNKLFASSDLELLDAEIYTAMKLQMKRLEQYLFILPTIVTLGPFIGLLGTVWGSLISISKVSSQGMGGESEAMFAGLSLALATTVVGLLVSIPALVGYNYLKNGFKDLRGEMEDFSHRLLVSIELHIQDKTDATKTTSLS